MSKEAFIELVTADQPDAPAYFTYDAVLNSRERRLPVINGGKPPPAAWFEVSQ
jgi:hypothetical protein